MASSCTAIRTCTRLGDRLIISQTGADRRELGGREEVVVTLVVSGGGGPEVFELVEEALEGVTLAVEPSAGPSAHLSPFVMRRDQNSP